MSKESDLVAAQHLDGMFRTGLVGSGTPDDLDVGFNKLTEDPGKTAEALALLYLQAKAAIAGGEVRLSYIQRVAAYVSARRLKRKNGES